MLRLQNIGISLSLSRGTCLWSMWETHSWVGRRKIQCTSCEIISLSCSMPKFKCTENRILLHKQIPIYYSHAIHYSRISAGNCATVTAHESCYRREKTIYTHWIQLRNLAVSVSAGHKFDMILSAARIRSLWRYFVRLSFSPSIPLASVHCHTVMPHKRACISFTNYYYQL